MGRFASTPDCILSFLKVNARMLSAGDITTREKDIRSRTEESRLIRPVIISLLSAMFRRSPGYSQEASLMSTSHSHLHVHRSRPLFAPDVTCNAGLVRSISFNIFYCARQLPILFHSHEPQFAALLHLLAIHFTSHIHSLNERSTARTRVCLECTAL